MNQPLSRAEFPRSATRAALAAVMAGGLLLHGLARAAAPGEKALTMGSLPPAVQRTAREQARGAVVRSIVQEMDEGQWVYEISLKVKGLGRDLIIGKDGKVLVAEDEKPMASLPEAVRKAFLENAKGKILIVESVTRSGVLSYYEAQVRSGRKVSELKIGLDGKVVPPDREK